jgi:two-component system, chemotaxis family, CheB/CheR fusion protein
MTENDAEFENLIDFLRSTRGLDVTGYKRSSLMRRTRKRMREVGIEGFPAYADYLGERPEEFDHLFATILINVTSFFRDPPTWQVMAEQIVPELLEREQETPIRVWSAGCASGQEPYSVAIMFAEALGTPEISDRVKIYATDVDDHALSEARRAEYLGRSVESIPPEMRERYLQPVGTAFGLRPELRRSVIFGKHNLVSDPPISRLDLLLCRNTLMYFNAPLQTRIMESFHFALRPEGYLVLGKSEVMLTRSDRFEPHDLKRRVFRPKPHRGRYDWLTAMREDPAESPQSGPDLGLQLRAFEAAELPQVVLDADRKVVMLNRSARDLFRLSDGDRGKPIQDLEMSYRPAELRTLIDRAVTEGVPVSTQNVEWQRDGEATFWSVTVAPLTAADSERPPISIMFSDVTAFRGLERELERSQREVQTAYEELQSTVEELETTNEELQSTNEELETTNEELQSTNEELETMNEELQSTNEELETINDELRERSGELNEVNFFFESVLLSLKVGVIVTDGDLRIQVWNEQSHDLWGLRGDEVIGEHLLNLDIGLPVQQLRDPARACLAGRSERESLTLAATNRRGRSIECMVTVVPLKRNDEIHGVVILADAANGAD